MDYRQRRKEQAQQTEQAILQAAMELARENSFDKVSVRDICQRAGITTGAFYHHFRSKEDLLSRGFSPLDRHMEEALSGHETDAPPQRLWLILSTYASFIEAQGWELVARYYQRRLDAPDDASSMDPTRYTLRAMLDCLRQAEEERGAVVRGEDGALVIVRLPYQLARRLAGQNDARRTRLDRLGSGVVAIDALAREGDKDGIGLHLARIDDATPADAVGVAGPWLSTRHVLEVLYRYLYHARPFVSL